MGSPKIQKGIHWTGSKKSREHILNHKTYIHEGSFQALPNQQLSILLQAHNIEEGTRPLICKCFNTL